MVSCHPGTVASTLLMEPLSETETSARPSTETSTGLEKQMEQLGLSPTQCSMLLTILQNAELMNLICSARISRLSPLWKIASSLSRDLDKTPPALKIPISEP